jgi:hypothetical protein
MFRKFACVVATVVAVALMTTVSGLAPAGAATSDVSPARASFAVGDGKPALSKQPADYIPATIDGKEVVVDPRSPAGSTVQSCQIPVGGVVVTPLVTGEADISGGAFGGIWECLVQSPVGTGFVAGIDASKVVPTTPKLSTKALYADKGPPVVEPGSLKVQKVKVGGQRVKTFVYRGTMPDGTVFEIASAEPGSHLLVTATTLSGTKPLPYLTAMLKAGARKPPRAG